MTLITVTPITVTPHSNNIIKYGFSLQELVNDRNYEQTYDIILGNEPPRHSEPKKLKVIIPGPVIIYTVMHPIPY